MACWLSTDPLARCFIVLAMRIIMRFDRFSFLIGVKCVCWNETQDEYKVPQMMGKSIAEGRLLWKCSVEHIRFIQKGNKVREKETGERV